MSPELRRAVATRAPVRPRTEDPRVLQVWTASQTYPAQCELPEFRQVETACFDATRSSRDSRPSLAARLVRSQQGVIGKLLARALARSGGGAARLTSYLKAQSPALVHCLSGTAMLSLVRSWELGAPEAPFIASITGTDLGRAIHSPWWAPRLRSAFRHASALLVDGSSSADDLRRLGCEPDQVIVSRPGVDLDSTVPAGPRTAEERRRDPRLKALFCGPFVERQGISFALEATARLVRRSPGIHLRLVGAGPLLRAARALAEHLGILRHVEFLGARSRAEIAIEMRNSDVLVCPCITASDGDRETGPPPAILLAMAAALPIVATRHADIPEAVVDAQTGFLADERDVDGLATALLCSRGDAEAARRMGLAGRELMEREHDAVKWTARLGEIYASRIARAWA